VHGDAQISNLRTSRGSVQLGGKKNSKEEPIPVIDENAWIPRTIALSKSPLSV